MIDKINGISDKIVAWEIEVLAKPFVNGLKNGMLHTFEILTQSIPDIAAIFTIACAIGLMASGNGAKWLSRWAIGIGGAVIWIINS